MSVNVVPPPPPECVNPPPPTLNNPGTVPPGNVSLSWSNTGAPSYYFRISPNGISCSLLGDYCPSPIYSTSIIRNLTAGTYTWWVHSVGTKGGVEDWSCYSNYSSAVINVVAPTPTPTPPPGNCSVTLTATPSSGNAPLNDVDLTASVGGTQTGNILYEFDCTNNGTIEHTSAATSTNPYTIANLCNYSSNGTYTANVNILRGATGSDPGCVAQDIQTITVSTIPPTPRPTPTATPAPPFCTDSDGRNYSTAGILTTNHPDWPIKSYEKCYTKSSFGFWNPVSSCSPPNCYLNELYCTAEAPNSELIPCPSLCLEGTCNISTPTPTPTTPTITPTPFPTSIPSPSPSFTFPQLKTLLQNYLSTQDSQYFPIESKVNILDGNYVMRWIQH